MSKFTKQFQSYCFVRLMSGANTLLTEDEFRTRLYNRGINYIDMFKYYVNIFRNPEKVIAQQFHEAGNEESLYDIKKRIYGIINIILSYGTEYIEHYIGTVTETINS
jgi:hypothetical protein